MFERILIANRGEVATRVARTCRRIGVETVGVHVLPDHEAPHVEACDESILLGDQPGAYLDAGAILAAAREGGVHAVHPGYGRLASDPEFARLVEAEGLIFVGPAAEHFEQARNRLAVRAIAAEVGVRTLPSHESPIMEANEALAQVAQLEYPVVIKPVRGVGEPDLRVCADVAALADALAEMEPLADHGGAYLEPYLERARHVEVQLIVDGEEAFVLSDREVSLRKDGVRLIGESPAPALDQLHHGEAMRGAMWDASAEVATRLGCRGLASCHFVIDADSVFYFVGFTPSLQVEHPTTEMRAGIDLVEMQLRLAAGESIPDELRRVEPTGAALQARVYAARDPESGLPFAGRVEAARWPPAPQGKVRIETGVQMGSMVAPEYSPLVCTVTTFAPTRHDALLMLDRVLAEIHLRPLVTNLRLLRKALNHQSVLAGQYDEELVDRS
ncbi:MAG: biotin carboxylase N-terminal domain-containing protein [Sandaracinaceae bacterium]